MDERVIVYTRAYNTKPYIKQCIESVLAQTYTNFEYILVDNGCTDGSGVIMQEYAAQDKRIQLIQYKQNSRIHTGELIERYGTGSYVTILDSDDWWEPDYLERLLKLALDTRADIVSTGTHMHLEGSGQKSIRELKQRLILSQSQYAEAFPYYHAFFRTTWAKLFRTELYLRSGVSPEKLKSLEISYGADTISAFSYLRHSKCVCLDNSVLHHYRIHNSSVSYQYDHRRFKSDVYLYNDAIDFLSAYGPISSQNRNFLQAVYSNAVTDTTAVIQSADLSPADKLREYHAIARHPITLATYRECTDESAERSRSNLLMRTLKAGAALRKQDDTDLCAVAQALSPHCGQAITVVNAGLFLEDHQLLQALLHDDADTILGVLLERIRNDQGVKKYMLSETIRSLAVNNPLLCQINDIAFLKKYSGLYHKVWKGECLDALNEMAGLLIENKVNSGREAFLTLFISLAALEEQTPAFLFGKMQLAWHYLQQGRQEECRTVAGELTEMGLDSEELSELRQTLEEKS